jgi:hypothetical protein
MKRLEVAVTLLALACLGIISVGHVGANAQMEKSAKKETKALSMSQALKAHTTAGATGLAAPIKLCSGIHDSAWRDTIVAPDSWKTGTCQTFAWSIGTEAYQLGCADANGFTWGNVNGGSPANNSCNWG